MIAYILDGQGLLESMSLDKTMSLQKTMKYIVTIILSIAASSSMAQQSMNTAEDYLRKSRKQETIAWVLAGSGVTMIAAGTIIAVNTNWEQLDYDDNNYGRNETIKAVGAVALIGTGIVAAIGSVPLFIISSKNKSKASISMGNQKYPRLTGSRYSTAMMPSLSLKVRF